MGIKVIVDNNFFDRYREYQDSTVKGQVRKAFKNRQLSFYPCLELVEELLSIYESSRQNLLQEYSSLFLDMIGYRLFNGWNRIVRSELGLIRGESIYLSSEYTKNIENIFQKLSQGNKFDNSVKEILERVRKNKEESYLHFKKNQSYHFELFEKQNVAIPKMSFDDFYNKDFVIKIRKDLIKDIYGRAGQTISEEQVDKIVDNHIDYPYFYISSRVFMAIFYKHIVQQRRVGEGDSYDQYYLIYLTQLDYLVSDDTRLRELAEDVFGTSKVVSFSEFIRLISV